MSNPRPLFEIKDATVYDVKEFGKEKNHLEIIFENSKGKKIKAISICSILFYFTLSGYSQSVFMYGENGTKIYFQEIDSIVQIKFKKNSYENKITFSYAIPVFDNWNRGM
jgi:hypothetical protein